jgi:hypothetical protein
VDDPEKTVSLSCHRGYRARYDEPVVSAAIKTTTRGSMENKTFVMKTFYERENWCLNCARSKVSELGGSIDWLL